MTRRWMCLLFGLLLIGGQTLSAPTHVVTASLSYDFSSDNACSATVTTGCLKQFNIYDVTNATAPVLLFSIPAPTGASTQISGITGSSPAIVLKSGIHTFAATAAMADGTESDPNLATATATVKPGAPVNFALTVK